MKNVLIGNGINIQFGGKAYTSDFILRRAKNRSRQGAYNELMGNQITGKELANIFDGFVDIANRLKKGKLDSYMKDEDLVLAVEDFKKRYNQWYPDKINTPEEIMLEDWFLLFQVFFLENIDLNAQRNAAVQGLEQIVLDAIYNGGKLQELHKQMGKNVAKYLKEYDNIFTLNYDNNIEKLTGKMVYHLHGDFSVLKDSENPDIVQGFLRKNAGEIIAKPEWAQCYCNALLNYSGDLKYRVACENHKWNVEIERIISNYTSIEDVYKKYPHLKVCSSFLEQWILTKINHPNLSIRTEYHFDKFQEIEGELDIIGLSPRNDAHIFRLVQENSKITKIHFFYFDDEDKDYIEGIFDKNKLEVEKVDLLWGKLGVSKKKYGIVIMILSKIYWKKFYLY